jgi:hypothetical protein
MLLAVRPLCRDSNAAGHTLTAVEISKEFLRLIVEDSCCSEPHAIHARAAIVRRALLALRRIKRRLLADYEGDAQRASLPVDKKQGSYRSGYRDLADQ